MTDTERRLAEAETRLRDAARREAAQERRLQAFQEIGTVLASTLNQDPLLDRIVVHVARLLEADRCLLYILDRTRNEVWARLPEGTGELEVRMRVGDGIAGLVARSGRGLNLKDAYKHPQFDPAYDQLTGYHTRSMLCQPLLNYQRRIVGVIQVLNKRGSEDVAPGTPGTPDHAAGYFTVEDERLLEAVAAQAAMSIENSRLYLETVGKNLELMDTQARLRAKVEELDVLFRIEQELTRTDDLDTLLTGIVRHAVEAVPSEVGAVALSEGSQEIVTLCRSRQEDARRVRLAAGEGVLGRVARGGRSVLLGEPDVPGALDVSALAPAVRDELRKPLVSVACVPLVSKGQSIGALAMYNKSGSPRTFSPDDVKLLTLIAGQTTKAIQRAREREHELNANRLATVGQLLSGVLHDIRTPMSIISGYAQLMASEEDPAERDEYAASIRKQISMLDQMTREILAYARGERTLLIRKVLLPKFVEEAAELLREEFAGRKVALEIQQDYRGMLWMDETKLRRVVFNLARNAREAMPAGGTFRVRVTEDTAADVVELTFTDTGAGIPEEIRDRLFGNFVTSGKEHGTGLGLAIVKRIVEEHGGTISFATETGAGTTFTLRLPRSGPPRPEPDGAAGDDAAGREVEAARA